MATTPENKVKKKVSAMLKEYGAYSFMPVQAGYGQPALDYYCCYKGWFLAVETKAPGKKMTTRQQLTARQITNAGGIVFCIDGSNYDVLEQWLKDN